MAKRQKTTKSQREQNFYETLPGTMTGFGDFSTTETEPETLSSSTDSDLGEVHAQEHIARYGLMLLALLVLQIILFVVLIRSTVNLG